MVRPIEMIDFQRRVSIIACALLIFSFLLLLPYIVLCIIFSFYTVVHRGVLLFKQWCYYRFDTISYQEYCTIFRFCLCLFGSIYRTKLHRIWFSFRRRNYAPRNEMNAPTRILGSRSLCSKRCVMSMLTQTMMFKNQDWRKGRRIFFEDIEARG